MLTTYDRYLLKRYLHTLVTCFVTVLGVFIVFDAFTNADEFQKASLDGAVWPVVSRMAIYYACQSSLLLGLLGHILCVLSVMIVLVVVQRTGELHPVLAAGVPLYRVVLPLVIGVVGTNVVMLVNQEIILPELAPVLQTPRGRQLEEGTDVRPSLDFATHILISARRLFPGKSQLEEAEFVLPVPDVVTTLATLEAPRATFVSVGPDGASGWLLEGVETAENPISLSEAGRSVVRPGRVAGTWFVVSGVTPDQLAAKSAGTDFLSTPDLLRRVSNRSQAARVSHEQSLALHARLTRPLLNIAAVFLAVPFLVRREGRGLVANVAIAGGVMLLLLGGGEACLSLAKVQVMRADIAAWSPVVICGMGATWWSRQAET